MKKYLLGAAVLLALSGCNGDYQYYRYPCQDPANWDRDECKPPICEVSRTCPEHIFPREESQCLKGTKK
jgi:hypothetical protein